MEWQGVRVPSTSPPGLAVSVTVTGGTPWPARLGSTAHPAATIGLPGVGPCVSESNAPRTLVPTRAMYLRFDDVLFEVRHKLNETSRCYTSNKKHENEKDSKTSCFQPHSNNTSRSVITSTRLVTPIIVCWLVETVLLECVQTEL